MKPFVIAPLAQSDLEEIWNHVALNSVSAADRLLATFQERFLLLADHPLLGELREELRPNLRSFSIGTYVLYYQVNEQRVRIVRVLHGARDVRRLF